MQEKKLSAVYTRYKRDLLQGITSGYGSSLLGDDVAGLKLGWFAAWLDGLDDTAVLLVTTAIAFAPYFVLIAFIHSVN